MKNRGFTLIELLIVMSVVAILVSIITPSFRSFQQEAWISKAEQELGTLQLAVESYYRHHDALPADITTTLINASPKIISAALPDPWETDTINKTYGFTRQTINGSDYYVIYSKGMNGGTEWSWAADGSASVTFPTNSDDIIKTNAAIQKE